MNGGKTLFLALLFAAFSISSCSGLPKGTGSGGTGTATVSFTLVADTLPANPSIFSFRVSITNITLKPATGSTVTFTPANPIVDLMRLQSDTAFLGALAGVTAGTYTVTVSLSSPATGPTITFLNDTGSALTAGSTNCAINAVCAATLSVTGNPVISSFTFTASSGGKQGLGLDFNLKNAITISGGVLTVNFNPASPNPGVFTAFTLPRQNANLGSNQLELIEDFTGVVSLSGSNVTITSPTRGALTAAIVSGTTFFDQSPAPSTLCANPPSNCAAAGQIASVDAFLNSDGTLSLKEFEPLTATQQDLVEGIVSSIPTQTQFGMVVKDKTPAATGSLIAGLNTGDLLTVNIPAPQPFFIDTKGLAVSPGNAGLFEGASNTTVIRLGQAISVHVTAFTAASGTTPASATADTVTLRWSRLIAAITSSSTTLVNVNAVPSYFGLSAATTLPAQVFTGTLGTDGVTNLDGVTDAGGLNTSLPVGLRALYVQNATNTALTPFLAAKIRQH